MKKREIIGTHVPTWVFFVWSQLLSNMIFSLCFGAKLWISLSIKESLWIILLKKSYSMSLRHPEKWHFAGHHNLARIHVFDVIQCFKKISFHIFQVRWTEIYLRWLTISPSLRPSCVRDAVHDRVSTPQYSRFPMVRTISRPFLFKNSPGGVMPPP